jgi:peptidoglycan/LPS O-acetylase OafA/YrhL
MSVEERAMPVAETPGSAGKRHVGLDLLRVFAVLLVLGRHMWLPSASWPAGPRAALGLWHAGGWVGVDLFFVLSGFLVSGLLFAEFRIHGRISPLRFYARRAWKIYPAYFVMLAATSVVVMVQGGEVFNMRLAAEALFFQNYTPGLWNHTWSLAVEEHFYLVLPLVLLLVLPFRARTPSSRSIVLLGAVVAVGEIALRVATALNWDEFSPLRHLSPTHLRLDSLFFGVTLSYAYHFHNERFVRLLRPWRWALVAGGLLLLAPAFLFNLDRSPLLYTVGFSVLYVGSGMLMVGALLCDGRRSRVVRSIAVAGPYSYSIYLWHMPVLAVVLPWIDGVVGRPLPYLVSFALFMAGSLSVGVVMSKLVEVPALRLRDRWHPSRGRAPGERPGAARLPRSFPTPVENQAIA